MGLQRHQICLQEIALHTSVETVDEYLEARKRIHEAAQAVIHNQQLQDLRAALLKDAADPILPIRTTILEDILTLRCPRATCHQAFVDFDGCLALKCRREGCGAHFCGICMQECATSFEAHRHAEACRYGNGTYYANEADIARLQNAARQAKLRALLQPLQPALAAAVLQSVAHELAGLGLAFSVADLG